MCRIFGIAYDKKKGKPEKLSAGQIARIMGQELVSGGPHAFGWMQNVEGDVAVRKFPGRIDEQLDKLNSIKRDCTWLVGHVRYATHGDSENLRNVHPIRHDNILGVHNGVLTNHVKVLQECGGRMDDRTEVDSEAIFAAVQHFGHKDGLAMLYGSMVAVYTDMTRPDALYIARSNSRALRLGWTKRGNLIFASEQRALDVLEDAGIEFKSFSGVSENRVLKIVNGDIRDRITYRTPATAYPARAAARSLREALIAEAARDEAEAGAMAALDNMVGAQRTATKRGQILFPTRRREIPKERLADWQRRHYNETSPGPDKPTKSERRKIRAVEVGHVVGPNKMKYKGKEMDMDDYLAMRANELSEAIIAGTETDEANWED